MYMLHCASCFLFSDVPYYQGRPLLSASGDEEYGFYCSWLVDYLRGLAAKEIPPCQQVLCAELEVMEPDTAVFWLADDGFYYSDWMQALERCIEDKLSYAEAVARVRTWWLETNEDVDPEEVEPFEELINPQLWSQANREWREQQAMSFPAIHADVGYRIPLARVLARESSPHKRLELIYSFYDSYNEAASK